ncbi:MAG: tetratricopeptide repeat protein [Gammaproteobacteria bacterium]|jgi:tetratricopeptide (TPR) repeat protein|nr:tetratricopeptide repeat protein [Gammaproteobacteria bacterium]
MIARALLAGLLLMTALAAAADFEHPDTAGMDPALAAQIETAIELIDSAAAESPSEHAAAWGELAMLYQATGFAEPSAAALDRAMSLDPFDGRWPYLKAIAAADAGLGAEARSLFLRAIALNRRLALPGWTRIGRTFLDNGEPRQALRALERALDIDGDDAAALSGAGEAQLALEQYDAARQRLERALAIEPRANRLHYPLAMAWRGLGDEAAMRRHLGQAGQVGVSPDDPVREYIESHAAGSRIHMLRGRKAWNARDLGAAEAAFARAAEADPASAAAWTNLGTTRAELGRLEEARTSLERALELDPGAEIARENLVAVLRRLGRPQAALGLIEDAPGEIDAAPWRRVESARILFDLGRPGEAADRLLAALDEARDLDLWTEALTALVAADRLEEAWNLATDGELSSASDPVLAAWVGELARSAEPSSEAMALALRLTARLYDRNPEERYAALHVNVLLKRHGRCREALAWLAARAEDEDTSAGLAAFLEQWSMQLADSPECTGSASETNP